MHAGLSLAVAASPVWLAKDILKGDIRIPTSRTSKAESTVVSEFDSECGTMYADTVITWDSPADVGNVPWTNTIHVDRCGADASPMF